MIILSGREISKANFSKDSMNPERCGVGGGDVSNQTPLWEGYGYFLEKYIILFQN